MELQVKNEIINKLGSSFAHLYFESASMFNAVIETGCKHRYFIESSQFESSTGERLPREYALKVIGDKRIFKVKEFKSKNEALDFFSNMEFTNKGGLRLESYNVAFISAYQNICEKEGAKISVYNDGYSALHVDHFESLLITYTEGDVLKIHCATADIHKAERKAHVEFQARG